MTPRKMGARFQAVVLSSMPAALFVAACSVAGDQESVGQTQEAIVGSSNVPALSSDYILTTQGAGENTLKVIPSRRNSACQDGAVVMSLGSSKQLMTRPLFENNWATLDTTTNGVPFAFPGVTSQEAMTSTDNQIVRMRDGSLLAAHITKTWAPVSPPPPYASLPVYYNGAQYQSGTRNELLLSRSTDCGATWQRWGSIDSALVAGGIYGWPQPYCNPGTGLSCQWTDPATGLLTFWVGGWDRPEVYADPWSPWVYVSLDGDGGPYNPSPGNGANYHAGLVLASSTGGTSWQLLGTLPEGTPFAMTTTPNKRFYAFSCPAGVPTLYYTTDPNNPGTLNGGVSLQTIDPSLPSCVNGFNGLDINANLQSYTIGRVSKDTFSSVVRIVYPMTNGYGTQSLETAYVSVSDANPSNPPIVTVATTIDAAGPALNSTVFPTIVEPDYVDTPAGFQTDRSLLYWLESSGTNGGQPDLSPQFCARFYVLGSGIRNPGPYSLTRSNGTPVCWSVSPGNGIGDYMTGGFFWDKRRLNFLAQWLETDGAIHANLVRVSPHARTLQQLGLPGDVNGDGMADLVATGYSQGQWVFIKGHRVWTQTYYAPVALSNGDGTFNVPTPSQTTAGSAGQSATGDFNGDGLTDVLSTPTGSYTPLATSNGDGSFTTSLATSFKVYSGQAGASVLSGDFDGDGLTDFLATGVAGWTSIPIAFSNGDGTFNIQNVVNNGSNAFFAAVASQQGAKVVVGDFDGDGRDDLAATGGVQPNGQPWGTLPVALSNGDGTFTASNLPTTFQTYSQPSGMAAYAGDFDGDGRTDIAILGAWPAGLGSIPIAYSNGDGTFNVSVSTDWSASTFASVAGQQSARVVVGDFNGDGYDDFAATGGLQPDGTPWGSIPMAFSGGGTFTWHNAPSTFQTYSGQVGVRVESSWK